MLPGATRRSGYPAFGLGKKNIFFERRVAGVTRRYPAFRLPGVRTGKKKYFFRTPGSRCYPALPGVQVTRRSNLVKKKYFLRTPGSRCYPALLGKKNIFFRTSDSRCYSTLFDAQGTRRSNLMKQKYFFSNVEKQVLPDAIHKRVTELKFK